MIHSPRKIIAGVAMAYVPRDAPKGAEEELADVILAMLERHGYEVVVRGNADITLTACLVGRLGGSVTFTRRDIVEQAGTLESHVDPATDAITLSVA